MIDKDVSTDSVQLTLSPNKSMSWQTNKKILLAMFCLNMIIAAGWTYMGAWPVLPFAGLEIALVALGMYYASWKLNFKEVLIIDDDTLHLQKGVYFPKQEWEWPRDQVQLMRVASNYRMSPAKFLLTDTKQSVEIGAFLSLAEKKQLRKELASVNLPIQAIKRQP